MVHFDDRVGREFAEPSRVGDDCRYAGGHHATEASRRLADSALAQVQHDVGLFNPSFEFLERHMTGDLNPIFEAVAPNQRAHVKEAVRLADQRVTEVALIAQGRQHGQRAFDPFVRRDQTKGSNAHRAGSGARRRARRGCSLRRDVVLHQAHRNAGRDLFQAGAAPL